MLKNFHCRCNCTCMSLPGHNCPRPLELTSVHFAQSVLMGSKAARLGCTHAAVVAAPYVPHHRIPHFPSYIRFQWRCNGMTAKALRILYFILFLDASVLVSWLNISQKFEEKCDHSIDHGCKPRELRFVETKRRGEMLSTPQPMEAAVCPVLHNGISLSFPLKNMSPNAPQMENELSREDFDITAGLQAVTHTVCPSPCHVIGTSVRPSGR